MEAIIRKFWIHTLKAQLALRQQICAILSLEFEAAGLTFGQRAALAHRWDDTLKEGYVLQLMIDLHERQEKEEHGCEGSPIPKA